MNKLQEEAKSSNMSKGEPTAGYSVLYRVSIQLIFE